MCCDKTLSTSPVSEKPAGDTDDQAKTPSLKQHHISYKRNVTEFQELRVQKTKPKNNRPVTAKTNKNDLRLKDDCEMNYIEKN